MPEASSGSIGTLSRMLQGRRTTVSRAGLAVMSAFQESPKSPIESTYCFPNIYDNRVLHLHVLVTENSSCVFAALARWSNGPIKDLRSIRHMLCTETARTLNLKFPEGVSVCRQEKTCTAL